MPPRSRRHRCLIRPMNSENIREPQGSSIRLSLIGLISLCVSLVVSSALVTHFLGRNSISPNTLPTLSVLPAPDSASGEIQTPAQSLKDLPPWGELLTLDIELEQPEEYVSFEATSKLEVVWVFSGCSLTQTRNILASSGMQPAQVDAILHTDHVEDTATSTVVKPSDEQVIAISPEVRAKLYSTLGQWPVNNRMANPYHLPSTDFSELFANAEVPPQAVELVKKLSYQIGNGRYFSDPEVVLHQIPSAETRLQLLKMLTYQTAVLARIRLRPDSDLDKLLGYWGSVPGVRSKDLRPLLESIRNTPEGGTLSLLYFLPAFARERLFTFPLPSSPGDVKMDCHWSALNFFNETPDPRFQDNEYASSYIKQNCYSIGKPSMCGDLVFLINKKDEVIHSAVYIADDLVFTKNGINFAQPWILMRIPNLRAVFSYQDEPRIVYYRRKEA